MRRADELRKGVDEIPWYHSIHLGHGVVTPGDSKTIPLTAKQLPDFSGRSVLDIGAWDGYYSFLAERRGASRVVALDHYVWGVDFGARQAYWEECRSRGVLPDLERDVTDFWRPETLPGRRAFDFAHEALHSRVEPVVGNFLEVEPDSIGRFDIVLFLGVLYHLPEPLAGLRSVRELTKEVAVIETEAIEVLGYPSPNLLLFFPGDELGGDFTNWYVPTLPALHAWCRAAGFGRVETKMHLRPFGRGEPLRWLPMRARRFVARFGREAIRHHRVVVHAFV
ncbi:MAG: class I SAM-dependent methyltransferase [Actinomycetota bacterium]